MEDRYDTSEFVETSAGRLQHSPTEVSTSVVHESPGEAVPSLNEQRFAVSSTNVIVMEPSAVNSDVLTSVQENLSAEQTVTNELSRDGHVTFVPAVSEENDKAFISEVSRSKDRSRGRRSNSRALSSRFFTSPYGPPSKDYTLRETFYLAYQTLGIVYGDLSTSPLYVYPTINVTDPSERDFLGILSLIFWTLTLIGVLKYTLIVLHADDHGEVISAIEGIQTAVPSLHSGVVVVVSAVILVLLFFLQRFGTERVSLLFSPIMAAWLISTPIIGIYNISVYYPGIFKAFSPAYIVYFFKDNGKQAWLMLGGTVLCITGAEAMYADLGHFTKRSIQLAFCTMVYPSVLLTYAGQTAYLIAHPENHHEGFFRMIPERVYWPMFVVATLAAIVASQGLISATFSIIKQSVALDYFPRVKLVHTSADKEGQIYSPEINYILMILCLAVVFGFRSSSTIGNAFGVAVVLVMLITTCLMALVMLVIWQCRLAVTLSFLLLFCFVEGIYFSSVVTKVPQGGWLPFVIALVVTVIMFSWNMGCQAKYLYEMRNQITRESLGVLLQEMGSVRVPGICFFCTDLMSGVPPIVHHYVRNVRSLHCVLVFTTVRFLPLKTVLPAERFLVGRAGFDGVYRCVARYGYRDVLKMHNNEFLDQFLATLTEYIMSNWEPSTSEGSISRNSDSYSNTNSELSVLKKAAEDGAVYVLGRGELKVSKTTKLITRLLIGKCYKFLRANCRSEASAMDIPCAQYLEIGMQYHI